MAADPTSDPPAEDNAFVALLLLIARRAPQPWFYQIHARETGANPKALAELAEWLYLEGLVQKAPGSRETGPGLTVTPFGEQVAADPALLDRLRRGEPLRERDVGATVRQSLLRDTYPTVTRLIIGMNVVAFLYGAHLASQRNILNVYLGGMSPDRRFNELLFELGAATTLAVLNGQWWRLIASTFLHSGMLHLGMNMFALNSLGKFVEQTWGGWRMAVIYALAAWAGSCCAVGYGPGGVGASGAVCGVMGAEGVWVALYGRYLPRGFTSRLRSQFFVNVVFLVFISLMPGISWQGHLGGAVGGAVAALLLHVHRFGWAPLRWPALLAVPLVVWGCFAWMTTAASATKEGRAALREGFAERQALPASRVAERLMTLSETNVQALLDQRPARRDPKLVEAVLTAMGKAKEEVGERLAAVERANPGKSLEDVKRNTVEMLRACSELCDTVTEYLNKGEATKRADERAVADGYKKVNQLYNDLLNKLDAAKDK